MQLNIGPVAFWLFAIVFFAAFVAITVRAQRKRTREMAAIAQQIGFRFLGDHWGGPGPSPRFETPLLHQRRESFSNAMTGSSGALPVTIADYTYRMHKSHVTYTVAYFSAGSELPPFELRPEGMFDKIGDALFHTDIKFDSHPEFSTRYVLRSPDEAPTRRLFTPGLLSYMEQIPPKWHIEASGMILSINSGEPPVRPADLPYFLDGTSAIARTIVSAGETKIA